MFLVFTAAPVWATLELSNTGQWLGCVVEAGSSRSVAEEIYRTTDEAVEWFARRGLRVRPQTLVNWRHVGGGPRFHRFGHRVVYAEGALTVWLEARLGSSLASTSEPNSLKETTAPRRAPRSERGSTAVVRSTGRTAIERATVGTRP